MGAIKNKMLEDMETPLMVKCDTCGGDGEYEVDVPMPHNAGRDIGYLDSRWETCEDCDGEGKVEKLCLNCGDGVVTVFHGGDLCDECIENGVAI